MVEQDPKQFDKQTESEPQESANADLLNAIMTSLSNKLEAKQDEYERFGLNEITFKIGKFEAYKDKSPEEYITFDKQASILMRALVSFVQNQEIPQIEARRCLSVFGKPSDSIVIERMSGMIQELASKNKTQAILLTKGIQGNYPTNFEHLQNHSPEDIAYAYSTSMKEQACFQFGADLQETARQFAQNDDWSSLQNYQTDDQEQVRKLEYLRGELGKLYHERSQQGRPANLNFNSDFAEIYEATIDFGIRSKGQGQVGRRAAIEKFMLENKQIAMQNLTDFAQAKRQITSKTSSKSLEQTDRKVRQLILMTRQQLGQFFTLPFLMHHNVKDFQMPVEEYATLCLIYEGNKMTLESQNGTTNQKYRNGKDHLKHAEALYQKMKCLPGVQDHMEALRKMIYKQRNEAKNDE